MPSNAVCTIVAKNYLAHARVLMESVRRHDPSVRRIVFLIDRPDGYFDPTKEPFEVILSDELALPDPAWFHFKYSVVEVSTAIKPYALEFALERLQIDNILYLDPDIETFASLTPILEALRTSNIVITPHLTTPLDDPFRPNELDILRTGAYNLGFIGVARGPETTRFLRWWQERLAEYCVVDLPRGLFVDQKWIDLVPGMFAGVTILRDAGYNVAYWNLKHRPVHNSGSEWRVGDDPLIFFHFSGADTDDDIALSKHQNRFSANELGDVQTLIAEYRKNLLAHGYKQCHAWPYTFGSFRNGVAIPDAGRSIQREAPELTSIDDPFGDAAYQTFLRVWNAPVVAPGGTRSGITRLAYKIYRTDEDLQMAMPDVFGGDYAKFLSWFASPPDASLNLSEVFKTPAREASLTPARTTSLPRIRLTRLAALIYESRPDLHRILPDPTGRDGMKYLAWILTAGKRQHHIPQVFLNPIQDEWNRALRELNVSERIWHQTVLKGMDAATSWKPYLASLVSGKPAPPAPQSATSSTPQIRGVNVLGYFTAETGVGQAGRSLARSAEAAGLQVNVRAIQAAGPERTGDRGVGPDSAGLIHPVNIFRVNADQIPQAFSEVPAENWQRKYNVGYWAWELNEFPDRWLPSFAYLNEVWVPSSFCQDAVAQKSPVPVLRMPYGVKVSLEGSPTRSDFGFAEDEFIFLTVFDMLSVFERKNPLAVIEAYSEAFPQDSTHRLVIHVNHPQHDPQSLRRLRQHAGPFVTILEKPLSRPEINGLINSADCLVSLHRSEGFGWTMAEAMYLGKPVLATGYSGNMDFTRPGHAFLVDYRMKVVGTGADPYNPVSSWADPRVDDAARQMRLIAQSPSLRHSVAASGQSLIRTEFAPDTVGTLISARLSRIEKHFTPKEKGAAF